VRAVPVSTPPTARERRPLISFGQPAIRHFDRTIAPKAKRSARLLLNSGDDEDEAPPTMPQLVVPITT
jgi:hypothetical protein